MRASAAVAALAKPCASAVRRPTFSGSAPAAFSPSASMPLDDVPAGRPHRVRRSALVEAGLQRVRVLGDVAEQGPVDVGVGLLVGVVALAVVGLRRHERDRRHAGGGERPAVAPCTHGVVDRDRLVEPRRPLRRHPAQPWRQLGRRLHAHVASLLGHRLEVDVGDRLARPVGVRLGDRVPGADEPVEVAVGVAVLLGGVEEEDDRALRLVAAHRHRLGHGERGRDGAGVVGAGPEVGVDVTTDDDHRAVSGAARQLRHDVVAVAAVFGHRDRDIALDRRLDRAGLELGLEPGAVGARDVDGGDEGAHALEVVGPQGVGGLLVPGWRRRSEGRDHRRGAALRGLADLEVDPVLLEEGVDEDDLVGDVTGGVELVPAAGADVDDLAGDALGRRAVGAGERRGRHRGAGGGDRGALEVPGIDRDLLEAHVRQPHGGELVGDVLRCLVLRLGAGDAEAEVAGAEAVEGGVLLLRVAVGDELVDGGVEGHAGDRRVLDGGARRVLVVPAGTEQRQRSDDQTGERAQRRAVCDVMVHPELPLETTGATGVRSLKATVDLLPGRRSNAQRRTADGRSSVVGPGSATGHMISVTCRRGSSVSRSSTG